jgi:hypothetical protein
MRALYVFFLNSRRIVRILHKRMLLQCVCSITCTLTCIHAHTHMHSCVHKIHKGAHIHRMHMHVYL